MTQMITYQTSTVNSPRNLSNILDQNSSTEYQQLYDYSSLRQFNNMQVALRGTTKEFEGDIIYNVARKKNSLVTKTAYEPTTTKFGS